MSSNYKTFAALMFTMLFGLMACNQDKADPAAQPNPQAQLTPSTEEAHAPHMPAPPAGTDYTQPGQHGKTGVETNDVNTPVIDVDTEKWTEGSGLMGGAVAEMTLWDTIQKLEVCPPVPIYVWHQSDTKSVAQCADGIGYAVTCRDAQNRAWTRAVNVMRSCEQVPSCRGQVVNMGQQWLCANYDELRSVDDEGKEMVTPAVWEKQCWTQYKVVCLQM